MSVKKRKATSKTVKTKKNTKKVIKKRSNFSLFLIWFWKASLSIKLFFLFILGLIGILLFVLWCFITLPSVDSNIASSRKPIVRIFNSAGEVIATYGNIYGDSVSLKDLPSYVPEAILAIEDKRFFTHFGFDIRGIARALYTNLTSGRKAQGASTITQQVAKNIFLSFDKTITRKVQEALLAIWLERNLSKEQILTLYLNRVYLGSGTYGIDAAAKRYFNRPASELTLYQSAVLSGILKAPSRYNPAQYPLKAEARAKLVLSKMVENGFISKEDMRKALLSAKDKIKRTTISNDRYFSDWILKNAESYIGEIDKDINIYTTFVSDIQKIADKALIDNVDGAVLAMSGGLDYNDSQFNRATDARRQPASTIKPFIYLTAFTKGYSPNDIVNDRQIIIDKWMPKNDNGKFYGEISLSEALIHSLNTIPIILTDDIGISEVASTLRRFGLLDKRCEKNLSLALGTCETTLLKLTGAYASIGNGGFPLIPYGIKEITDIEGSVLYQRHSDGRGRITSEQSILDIKDILAKVVTEGTGKRALSSFPVYGKTGTSQNNRDAWFIGFSEDLVIGVWVGNDNETPMPGVYGGNLPARIWHSIMVNNSKY